MSLFSKLFGGRKSETPAAPPRSEAPTETHKGFRIRVQPQKDGGQYRVAAVIEKDIDGQTKSTYMLRADSFGSLEQANEVSLMKAKQFINQMGDRIFA